MTTMIDDFSVAQVARRWEVSVVTVYNWLKAGKLKGYDTPLGTMVTRASVEEAERRRERKQVPS